MHNFASEVNFCGKMFCRNLIGVTFIADHRENCKRFHWVFKEKTNQSYIFIIFQDMAIFQGVFEVCAYHWDALVSAYGYCRPSGVPYRKYFLCTLL